MTHMRLLLIAILLASCAEAGKAGIEGRPDSAIKLTDSTLPPDAFISRIDAPPGQMTKTLDQNSSDTIKLATALACSDQNTGFTLANSYFRVFDPSAFGVTGDFHVTTVGFQVENCTPSQTVTVKVGTYTGTPAATLSTANMSTIASNTAVVVPTIDEVGGSVNAPITATIPQGSKLFIEIDSPTGDAGTNTAFYMGVNTAAETGFGYIQASDCSLTVPTNISSNAVAGTQMSLLMDVTGTY